MKKDLRENVENASFSSEKQTVRLKTGVSAVLFLSVCSVLTFCFCKFSFSLLKNHRNVVDRHELTRSYADIRPFGEQEKTTLPDVFYTAPVQKNEEKVLTESNIFPVPVIFEKQIEEKQEKIFVHDKKSVSIEKSLPSDSNNTSVHPPLISAYRDAPAVNQAIKTSNLQEIKPDIAEKENENASAEILDDLIVSGTVLLNETDEKLTQTAVLFEEQPDNVDFSKEILAQEKTDEKFDTEKETVSDNITKTVEEQKTAENKMQGTHWVDINALRAEIEHQKKSSSEPEKNKTEYVSVKQMSGNQTASLPDASISDSSAVVSEVPVDGTQSAKINQQENVSDVPVIALTEKKSEKEEKIAQKDKSESVKPKKKKKRRSPWKIAKVNGKSVDSFAVDVSSSDQNENEPLSTSLNDSLNTETSYAPIENISDSQKQVTLADANDNNIQLPAKETPSTVIYRNGKIKQIINADGTQTDLQPQTAYREKQNLEWLEGQEAAVWTNISQSDVPSVWSFASDNTGNSDKAKAFKTAATDQPPVMPPSPSAGNTAPVVAAPQPSVQQATPAASQPVPATPEKNNALQALTLPTVKPLTIQKQKSDDKPQTALLGKMGPDDAPPAEGNSFAGKLLSLFSKEGETSSQLPSVGSNTATGTPSDNTGKNTPNKSAAGKNASQKSMAAMLKNLSIEKKKEKTNVLPDEIRLTFKDGNSDLSASSVSLIKRFAQHANKDVQSVIEVRISEQFPEIQQQRFAIIRNILLGSGVEDSQILLYQSGRPPNTLILRTYIVSDEEYESSTSWLNGVEERLYYKKW